MKQQPTPKIFIHHAESVLNTLSRRAFAEQEADVESVHAMIYQLMDFQGIKATVSLEKVRQLLESGEWMVLLIFTRDNLQQAIGYALFYFKWSSATGNKMLWLEDLYIKSDYRGMSIGCTLMTNLAVCCQEMGWSAVDFSVLQQNNGAARFYKDIGAVMQSNWTLWRWTTEDMQKFLAKQ